jgi:hypothetical protein
MSKPKKADLYFEPHGSITLIRPQTARGRAWADEHIHAEPWSRLGGAIAADWRCAMTIYEGAELDGLRCE